MPKEPIEAESEQIMIMTAIEVLAFAVWVGFAINFFFYAWPRGDQRQIIFACAAILIFAIIGVAAHLLARIPPSDGADDDIQRAGIIAAQRGYLNIDRFTPAAGIDRTMVSYRLTVTGSTFIEIERGEIRMSIDDPQTPLEARERGDYTGRVLPRRIDPKQEAFGQARLAALTPAQMKIWTKGNQVMRVFFAGDIWYRDAFKGTPLHHKQFAYYVDVGGPNGYREGPLNNPFFSRNDEVDER